MPEVGIDLQQMEDSQDGEQKLVVSFDFPDLAQISEKGKTTDTPMGMSFEGVDLYHVEKSYECQNREQKEFILVVPLVHQVSDSGNLVLPKIFLAVQHRF